MFRLWSSLNFLPFFGLVGVLADDTWCTQAGDACILEVRSLNVVPLPDLPSQEHATNAGKEAGQQSIENARFPNPFSCLVDLTWGAAENTTAGSTVAGAETMFPFSCHLCFGHGHIFKRVKKMTTSPQHIAVVNDLRLILNMLPFHVKRKCVIKNPDIYSYSYFCS